MKKFTVEEQTPAIVTYQYEVVAETKEEALEIIQERLEDKVISSGMSINTCSQHEVDDSSIELEFLMEVIDEEEIDPDTGETY